MAIHDGSEQFHAGAAMIEITIMKCIIKVLGDSGCTLSLMSEVLATSLGATILPLDRPIKFSTANRSKLQAAGRAFVTFQVGNLEFTEEFLITNSLIHNVILGCNFFRKHRVDIMFSTDQFVIGETRVPMYGSYNIKDSVCAISEDVSPGDLININSKLTLDQKERIRKIVNKFDDVFSKNSEDIGESTFVHKIELTSDVPVKGRNSRIPHTQKPIVEEEIRKMLRMDVIEESNSPYGAPIVIVKKKDNSVRFCVDYRGLNAMTKKDNYPMPYIDEELESFRGKRFFTTLDLTSGYWQFLVDEKARQYTAFNTHQGSFEFKRMPFGLCNAGATFQRHMQQLLEEFEFARNYIDDIIISSRTFEEHLIHLEQVLTKLRTAKLKVKPTKTHVADHETKYLGFLVSEEGIKVCPSRSEAITNYPQPTSQKEVRSFIGLASYYRKFIEGFSDIAGPLIALLSKSVKFIWTEECTLSFEKLIASLISPKILVYPDFTKKFCLTTDASKIGLGAVLSQPDGDEENVIAYASRTLKDAERNYTTTELELLAIVWAVERFKPYLFGTVFELITDHKPLTYLHSSTSTSSRLARWKLKLSDYSFDIHYKPGKENINADILSRTEILCAIEYAQNEEDMQRLQESDERINEVLKKVREADGVYKGFRMKNEILYCIRKKDKPYGTDEALRLVVPETMIKEVLETCHDYMSGAHLGLKKTLHKVGSRFYWYQWKDDVKAWINACSTCAGRKTPLRPKAPLHSLIEAEKPFDMIGIDFVGPLPKTENGNQWLLVITDYATRWVEAFPTRDSKARTVAEILIKQIIARYGAPKKLLSDRGRNFLADLIYQVCELYRTKKINTTAYHPQTNGLTEKFNGTLCQMLSSYMNEKQTDWDEYIEVCLFAYRTSKQETTKETPFRLLYGRDARLPSDIDNWSTKDSFIEEIDKAWRLAHRLIKESATKSELGNQPKQIINYQIDDWIRVERPATQVGLKKKFRRDLWSEPVQIIRVNSTENVLIKENPETWVHKNRIKPAETILRSGRISRPPERFQAGQ